MKAQYRRIAAPLWKSRGTDDYFPPLYNGHVARLLWTVVYVLSRGREGPRYMDRVHRTPRVSSP